ncbi:MAG: hypothetical protein LBP86_03780 [Azoarcus sp.]|nr:hypothetical protein [Azoarcus sp.]
MASDDKRRSKAARLRDVIDDVEATLAAGVRRSAVVEELKKHGLEMSLATFNTTLKRIRKKHARSQAAGLPDRPPIPKTVTPVEETGSHNPADLDQIISSQPDLAALAKLAKRTKK